MVRTRLFMCENMQLMPGRLRRKEEVGRFGALRMQKAKVTGNSTKLSSLTVTIFIQRLKGNSFKNTRADANISVSIFLM